MLGLKINHDKCICCKKCMNTCPANLFKVINGAMCISETPICIECLHCAAVCPTEAIELVKSNDNAEVVVHVDDFKWKDSTKKTIEEYIVSRRSYRDFNGDMVPREEIMHALKVSKWAPSAKNEHPIGYIVIEGKSKMDLIMGHIIDYVKNNNVSPEIVRLYEQGKNIVMGKASSAIIAYADQRATNPNTDAALALYSTELVLQSNGIGTCWSGYLGDMCNRVDAIREIINLPKDNKVYGVILIGYVENERFLNIPNRIINTNIKWI